jgi:hypothetical protein
MLETIKMITGVGGIVLAQTEDASRSQLTAHDQRPPNRDCGWVISAEAGRTARQRSVIYGLSSNGSLRSSQMSMQSRWFPSTNVNPPKLGSVKVWFLRSHFDMFNAAGVLILFGLKGILVAVRMGVVVWYSLVVQRKQPGDHVCEAH